MQDQIKKKLCLYAKTLKGYLCTVYRVFDLQKKITFDLWDKVWLCLIITKKLTVRTLSCSDWRCLFITYYFSVWRTLMIIYCCFHIHRFPQVIRSHYSMKGLFLSLAFLVFLDNSNAATKTKCQIVQALRAEGVPDSDLRDCKYISLFQISPDNFECTRCVWGRFVLLIKDAEIERTIAVVLKN
jgi:hypothetical protein